MSVDQAAAAVLSQIALAADGAVLGVALAYVAIRSIIRFTASSSALRKIQDAPSVKVSDLRSLLSPSDQVSDEADGGKIVIVRGSVEAKSAVEVNWKSLGQNNALVSHESGERGVILLRTQTVPFILVDGGIWPYADYVVVNVDGSRHPLPLVTVYHHLQPITASPYTFLQALFGHDYPVGVLDEEKILPLGKDITAVGICRLRNEIPEIKSCKDLPYFMSDMTKERMLVDLAFRTKVLLWSGIVLGTLAVGVLGYAAVRNWNKWKEWRQVRRIRHDNAGTSSSETGTHIVADEETADIPDGELCVICLMRRRRSAFIPCGHLVCCQRCALSVEREASPKCPVCRQSIRTSVRIYDS